MDHHLVDGAVVIGQPELSESSKFPDVFHRNQTRSGGRTVRLPHEIECLFASPISMILNLYLPILFLVICFSSILLSPSLLRVPSLKFLSLSLSLLSRLSGLWGTDILALTQVSPFSWWWCFEVSSLDFAPCAVNAPASRSRSAAGTVFAGSTSTGSLESWKGVIPLLYFFNFFNSHIFLYIFYFFWFCHSAFATAAAATAAFVVLPFHTHTRTFARSLSPLSIRSLQ